MNRDDLVRDTYAHFGIAIYRAQVLELSIVNAMVVARMPHRDHISREEIDSFMERQYENTLGQLVRALTKYVVVPASIADVLGQALSRRNWLAHRYFRERAEEFMTDAGCLRMIDELQAMQQLFSDANADLDLLVRPIREHFGLTDEAIAARMRAIT